MFEQVKRLFATRQLYLRTVKELNGLSDRELRDLSIGRSEINHVAHFAAYGAPAAAAKSVVAKSTETSPAQNRRAFA